MNRRAVLGLVGCGVGTVAAGRGVALAGCDATGASGADPGARWVFPAGDYRIGIESGASGSARLIVYATANEPERTFVLPQPPPPLPKERNRFAWVSVDATPVEAAAPATIESAMPVIPVATTTGVPDAAEAQIVFDDGPGVKATIECCGIGIAGHAYAVASVGDAGPTYLVRLDPASGRMAMLAISRHVLDVVAIYRRPGQNALCVVVADGKDVLVRGVFDRA